MDAETSLDFTSAWLVVCGLLCAVALLAPRRWFERVPVQGRALPIVLFGGAFALRFVPALALQLPDTALIHFDMDSYRIVGDLVRAGEDVYARPDRHPYLPFEMYGMALADWLDATTAIPFLLAAKMPQLLADAGIAVLLVAWPRRAVADRLRLGVVYALNPLTPLTAAIHGQFDSVPVFFLVLSVFVLQRERSGERRAFLAGLAFGFAVLAKTWPAFALPLLLWHAGTWRERGWFLAGSAAPAAVALALYWAIFGQDPYHAVDAIKGYRGVPEAWGYPLALTHLANADVPGARWLHDELLDVERVLLAVGVLLATWAVLNRRIETGVAVVILAFYAVTPGWGFHYLVWAVPFVLLGLPRVLAGAYIAVGFATLWAVFYGYGGVGHQMYDWFDLDSVVIRYSWAVGLPMWALTVALAVLVAAMPWVANQPWWRRSRFGRESLAREGATPAG